MADSKSFPQTLYVTLENEGEGDNEYLDLNGTLESKGEIGEDRLVAIYERKTLVIVKTAITLEPFEG